MCRSDKAGGREQDGNLKTRMRLQGHSGSGTRGRHRFRVSGGTMSLMMPGRNRAFSV